MPRAKTTPASSDEQIQLSMLTLTMADYQRAARLVLREAPDCLEALGLHQVPMDAPDGQTPLTSMGALALGSLV